MASELLDWSDRLPEAEWSVYRPVLERAQAAGIPFAVGGGLAFSAYARRWRDTKDMDLYVRPADRDAMVALLGELGFTDYFEVHDYDRRWIYRSHRDGRIVDVIWQMANYRTEVDDDWLDRGRSLRVHGLRFRLLPLEELVWSKLYVVQRERCDWPDLLNLVHAGVEEIDWDHLLSRLGDDAPVLGGLLSVFGWLCPERASRVPTTVRERVGILAPRRGPGCDADSARVRLLDTRDWFGAEKEG